MSKKWYAVQKGRKTGIFQTWDETKDLVNKYPGAKYKSFRNYHDAEFYLKGDQLLISHTFYTDGSCSKKIGGCGVVYIEKGREVYRLLTPVPPPTTNNYCELLALYQAVCHARVSDKITIFTDSEYSLNTVTKWHRKWRKNGWITARGDKVANCNIIKKIICVLEEKPDVKIQHVYGHQGNKWNELADQVANSARIMQVKKEENKDVL